MIGGDYNVIVNPQLDQHGYDTPHLRTKAFKHHNDWEASGTLIDIYRKKHKKGNAITYVPDTEHNRENSKLGIRMDNFLVSKDMNIKEVEIKHVSDNYYKISASADGGLRSRVCARETLRSAPHKN